LFGKNQNPGSAQQHSIFGALLLKNDISNPGLQAVCQTIQGHFESLGILPAIVKKRARVRIRREPHPFGKGPQAQGIKAFRK
jgi:hypothetical protein